MITRMRRALALVAAVALCGCSFAFVHGPKPPPAPPSDCTSSRLLPILDGVATGVFAVFGIYSIAASDDGYRTTFCDQYDSSCEPPSRAATIVTSLAIAALAGTSAYIGRNRVNECQAANYAPVVAPPSPSPSPTPPPAPYPTTNAPTTTTTPPPTPPPTPTPTTTPTPTPTRPTPTPTPKPTPTKPKPGTGSGSGDLPIPPSGLPVPGAT